MGNDILKIIQAGGHTASVAMAVALYWGGDKVLNAMLSFNERLSQVEAALAFLK